MAKKKDHKELDGADVIYHFLKDVFLKGDEDAYERFVRQAIDTLGVWMHPKYYLRAPIYLPYALRNASRRQDPSKGRKEAWGTPDDSGYFCDDNTLVKNLANSLVIESPRDWYNGCRGKNYIASHVWMQPADFQDTGIRAAARPDLYSFIPNVVWLPKPISRLTDREGSYAQRYIQKLSRHIYAGLEVGDALRPFVTSCWSKLPFPSGMNDVPLPDPTSIAFYAYDKNKADRKVCDIKRFVEILDEIIVRGSSSARFACRHRYVQGLNAMPKATIERLKESIAGYAAAVE